MILDRRTGRPGWARSPAEVAQAQSDARAYPLDEMTSRPVNLRVDNVKNNDERPIEPIAITG